MPGGLALDFLKQIVNVHWAGDGAVFVYGDFDGNIFHLKFTTALDKEPVHEQTAHLIRISGSSYAKKTFLVSGMRGEDFPDETVVLKSSDGITWTDGYSFKHIFGTVSEAESMGAVTFDPDANAFFIAGVYNTSDATTGYNYAWNRHYSSPTGEGWSKVYERLLSEPPGIIHEEPSPFPADHCSHNECIDETGQHVPDGNMSGYDTKPQIKMLPKNPAIFNYDQGNFGFGIASNEIRILYPEPEPGEEPDPDRKETVVLPMERVTCVAGANGIWLAGGFKTTSFEDGGLLVISIDDGNTWKEFKTTPTGIMSMVAAPLAKKAET